MLSIIKSSRWFFALLIFLTANQVFGHGMSESEKQLIIDGGNLQYISIGITHMLTGYDHLAFVFGIIFFLTRFKDIVKYITVFTLGHSITLIFATFLAVQVNYYLVDAVIALSVIYIAFHNLDGFKKLLKIKAPNMLAMIFGLGLIHGLGLSTRLQQLPLNEDTAGLLMNIISFNIGVEIGQITALTIMLGLITALRKIPSFKIISIIANLLLVIAGAVLFYIQIHEYQHAAHTEKLVANAESIERTENNTDVQKSNWKDTITVTIPAKGDIEYKLILTKGATFDYAWKTDSGELFFDFHGEIKGDATDAFTSFLEDTLSSDNGSLTATFEGTHGWYWKNDNDFPVVVSLNIKGEYQRLD